MCYPYTTITGAPTEIRTLTACLEGRRATITSLALVRVMGVEPTPCGLKVRCSAFELHPLVALTRFELAPSSLKDWRPSNSLQRLEPMERIELSIPPYQGGGLPLTYTGLCLRRLGFHQLPIACPRHTVPSCEQSLRCLQPLRASDQNYRATGFVSRLLFLCLHLSS